jgi:methylmalonyl-CoA mutase
MSFPNRSLNLQADFPPNTYQEWHAAAEKLLKGTPVEELLTTPLPEGITILPIYMPEGGISDLTPPSSTRGYGLMHFSSGSKHDARGRCSVAQECSSGDPSELNEQLRRGIERGLSAVHIVPEFEMVTDGSSSPWTNHRSGVSIRTLSDFEALLRGIDLERIPIMIQAGTSSVPWLALLTALAARRGFNLSSVRGSVASDPLGTLVSRGTLPVSPGELFDGMRLCIDWVQSVNSDIAVVHVDGTCYHDGGALSVQELGFALATGAEYLRELLRRGCTVDRVAGRFLFSFALSPHFFLEIAKIRSARLLWASIVSAFGGSTGVGQMRIHGRTSSFFATRFDPHSNLLRATTEALSGALAGCDSLHVSAFDECLKPADEFSRRIARNTQIILKEEAHVHHVVDPAGGSWYVEWLTEALAEKAWKVFQEIEAEGGMTQALLKGLPQQIVAQSFERRMADLEAKRTQVVGVNVYPNPNEEYQSRQTPSSSTKETDGSRRAQVQGRSPRQDPGAHGGFRHQDSASCIASVVDAATGGASVSGLFELLHGTGGPGVTAARIPARRLVEGLEDELESHSILQKVGEDHI